jgi:hypothetical protein
LQTAEPLGDKALAPLADGVAVATEFVGDLEIGGLLRIGGPQDEPAAEGQGLGSGARPKQALQARA